MKNYFRILVATDYSKAAESAERYAIQLAKATNSVITFLHVFETSPDYPKEFSNLERMDDSPMEFETRKLEQHIEELCNELKVTPSEGDYQCSVRQGKIAKEICAEAKAMKADFIALGTHDATAFQKIFKESHTWQVIDKAGIPVLAIPAEAEFSGIQNLVFATEYRKSELPVLGFLVQLAKVLNAELTVLHVANDVLTKEFENELFSNFANEIKAKINYDKLNLRLIHTDKLNDGLNEFCIKTTCSWLIMSPEKSLLLEKAFNHITSRTRSMTFNTYVPLFTIPDFNHPDNASFWKTIENQYNVDEKELAK